MLMTEARAKCHRRASVQRCCLEFCSRQTERPPATINLRRMDGHGEHSQANTDAGDNWKKNKGYVRRRRD